MRAGDEGDVNLVDSHWVHYDPPLGLLGGLVSDRHFEPAGHSQTPGGIPGVLPRSFGRGGESRNHCG